jgi:protein TonB
VVAAHLLLFALLVQATPEPRKAVEPIMVSLIAPPKVETLRDPPEPRPAKPRIQPKPIAPRIEAKPIAPPPLIAAASEAPAPSMAPVPAPRELPPIEPAPAPRPQPVALPVVPPSFSADYLDNPAPAYPSLSRRMGEQGKVLLRVLVNANGTADRVEIKSSSGFPRLDSAALETVKRWRFVPARQGDQPVAAWVLIPISFTLEG